MRAPAGQPLAGAWEGLEGSDFAAGVARSCPGDASSRDRGLGLRPRGKTFASDPQGGATGTGLVRSRNEPGLAVVSHQAIEGIMVVEPWVWCRASDRRDPRMGSPPRMGSTLPEICRSPSIGRE